MFKASLTIASILFITAHVRCLPDNSAKPRSSDATGFKSNCGTANEVAYRVGLCLEPILNYLKGNFSVPKNDQDLLGVCEHFNLGEKCVRTVARDCLQGLHRTATSSIATATRKFRNEGCKSAESRHKYMGALKCCHKKGNELSQVLRNHTAITQSLRDLPDASAEEKVLKFCCLLDSMDKEIERVLHSVCEDQIPVVLGIVHALTDDARATLCARPKCQNALNKVIPSKLKTRQNFIEPVAQILYLLGTD